MAWVRVGTIVWSLREAEDSYRRAPAIREDGQVLEFPVSQASVCPRAKQEQLPLPVGETIDVSNNTSQLPSTSVSFPSSFSSCIVEVFTNSEFILWMDLNRCFLMQDSTALRLYKPAHSVPNGRKKSTNNYRLDLLEEIFYKTTTKH